MAVSGRPQFIPREVFRGYWGAHSLRRFMSVGGMLPVSFINRREREGRPVRSHYQGTTVYRPLDVVAAARADGLRIDPPERQRLEIRIEELRTELTRLEHEREAWNRRTSHRLTTLCETAEALTGARMLTAEEIVSAATTDLLARRCGVYFLVSGSRIIYVGQSVNVPSRVMEHRGSKRFDAAAYIQCPPELLDIMESIYIHAIRPSMNARHGSGEHVAPISFNYLLRSLEREKNDGR